MKKIREAREFELYKKKVSIIDVYSVLISTPTRGSSDLKKYFVLSFIITTPPTPH